MGLEIRFALKAPLKCSSLLIYLLLLTMSNASYSRGKYQESFRAPGKFCGPKLTRLLQDYCELFYGPRKSHTDNHANSRFISEECCQSPCSILYIILSYCRKPKTEAIISSFGKTEMDIYRNVKRNTSITPLEIIMPEIPNAQSLIVKTGENNVRRKKHTRKLRRKRRRCDCRKDPKQIEKERVLMSRTVPQHVIGLAEHHESEPIIIANSL